VCQRAQPDVGLIQEGIDNGDIRSDIDADWEASALVAFLDGIRSCRPEQDIGVGLAAPPMCIRPGDAMVAAAGGALPARGVPWRHL
jgi:hypothetical protein